MSVLRKPEHATAQSVVDTNHWVAISEVASSPETSFFVLDPILAAFNSMDFISMDYEVSSSASGRIEANMSTARFSSLSLKEQLQAAMVEEFLPSAPTSRPRRKFLPRDQIEALINRGAVQQELTRSAPHIPRVIRDIYAQAVCSTRRRIFAILVLIDQTSLISGFMGNDLTDSILPISFCSNGVRSSLGLRENVIRCFTGFPHRVLDDFGSAQWALLVPIIGEYSNSVQALNLDHEYILPFIVDSTMEGGAMTIRGGFSTIYKVKIHKAHIGSQAKRYSYFAVKEISNSNDEAFTSELEALEKVSLLDHSHLVPVTASITRGQEKLFVFPWAETNLRQYWKGRSLSVQRSEVRCAKWTLQQLSGLASALDTLHNSALGSCRHGDLKPENILLFQDQSNLTSPGKLVISDFGFAKFSSQPDANENDIPGGYTVRYSPPEVRTALQRSRLYDVWSLGCLFLEFITWYLEGYEAVETLRTPLSLTNEDKTHEDDKFKSVFYETRHDSRHAGVNVSLKPGVLKSLARLRYNSRASPFLNLLDLIQYRMLEPSPTKRADALEVFSSVKVFTAEFDMPMNDGFCTLCHRAGEAEHDAWDVYGVKDPLQHNLIAGNMASECRTPNLSRLEDVHSDFVPQTTDHAEEFPEDEPSSPDLLPSMLPTNRELASPIHAQSWNDTIDSGYYTPSPAQAASSPANADGGPADAAVESLPLEANEENNTDEGATIDERLSQYTASLSSSVVDYPVEYGRRYHAFRPGSYSFPNDEVEMDRLDMAHALMVKSIGSRLFLAPLERDDVHRILDIGTGTGIWAVEIGDIIENAEVIGIDLSAIQPEWVPANVKFEIDDVESPWVGNKKYDFIMCRYMAASISDWPRLVRNIYDNLNPGGWAEFQDMSTDYYSQDGTYTEKNATWGWNKDFVHACESLGRDPCPGPKLEGLVRDHGGFQSVFHQRFRAPIGPWPKDPHYRDIGMLNLAQILEGLEAFSLKLFCGVLGRTREEVLVELAAVRKELKTGAFHAMFDLHVVYGQKPFEAEAEE
ncbi:hypothetical protein CcaCcLH18_00904 [Colletotrichum camelliae]|nr:hypothetical protein CcaCcLH18_00904 [Colletotrichum camelliae]